jgi:predicted MPP superfamily phosphohydrolase
MAATSGARAFHNTYQFVVTRHTRALPGLLAPVRIAHLTDLHFGPFIRSDSLRAWTRATNAAEPDIIVITGDFVDQLQFGSLEPLADALAQLRAPLGVWGVWGNHDLDRYRGNLELLSEPLRRAGVRMLRNESAWLRDDLHIVGVDDWLSGSPDLNAALAGVEAGVATILLNHNPDFLPDVPAGAVSLALCGHTHGGQVRFPFIGAPMTASVHGQRFLEGWVDAPVPGYVSRGLGVSLLPLRLLCPAELSVFDLHPA